MHSHAPVAAKSARVGTVAGFVIDIRRNRTTPHEKRVLHHYHLYAHRATLGVRHPHDKRTAVHGEGTDEVGCVEGGPKPQAFLPRDSRGLLRPHGSSRFRFCCMWSWAGKLGAPLPRAAAVAPRTHTLRLAHTFQAQRRMPNLKPPAPERLKPLSPTYYTAKPSYMDTLQMIDQLTREVKRELEKACVLAPNAPAPASSGKPVTWMSRDRLGSRLGLTLRASQHRSVTSRLSLLYRYKKVATDAFLGTSSFAEGASTHQRDLVHQIIEVLDSFADVRSTDASEDASEFVHTGTPSRGLIDERGVAYARGRRKVSHARVWLVRSQQQGLGEILINNAPLNQYFSRTAHREMVTWPLRLSGVLGMYNIFAIVRGGGASGQAGALAHGVANALVAALGTAEGENATKIQSHVQHLLARGTFSSTLTTDGVLIRDPRMVERKKPGLAKARKAYTWVKR